MYWHQKHATGRTITVLFIITLAVYLTMIFYSAPAVVAFAPGMTLFDLSLTGYTLDYATSLLEALGAEGRDTYLSLQLPLDFLYPALFAITSSLLLTWLFSRSFEAKSKVFYFSLVPILASLFDYIENIFIIFILRSYPDISSTLVALASLATILKGISYFVFFILLFWGVFRFTQSKRP